MDIFSAKGREPWGPPLRISRISCSLNRSCKRVGRPAQEERQEVRCGEANLRQGRLANKGSEQLVEIQQFTTSVSVLPISFTACLCPSLFFSLFVSSPLFLHHREQSGLPFMVECFLSCLDGDWQLLMEAAINPSCLLIADTEGCLPQPSRVG